MGIFSYKLWLPYNVKLFIDPKNFQLTQVTNHHFPNFPNFVTQVWHLGTHWLKHTSFTLSLSESKANVILEGAALKQSTSTTTATTATTTSTTTTTATTTGRGGSGVGPRPAIGQKAAVVEPLGSIISKMARTFHEPYSTNVSIAFFVPLLPMTPLVPPTPLFFNLVEFPREKSNALNVRGDLRKNLSEWPATVHSSQRLVIACY